MSAIQQEPVRVAAIYNPQTQTKAQLIEGFVVRQHTFKTLFEAIKSAKMDVPEQHYLILGRRGMGKTTLLLRLAYEVENDPALNGRLIPLVFNEEEYGIRRLFNFWERIMQLLEQKHPDFRFEEAELRRLSTRHSKDDDAYERALFDWLSGELERKGKKLVLFIDNFGDMARKLTDTEAHRLRKILQTSADLRIFAASAVVLEAFYRYDHPFYEFFKQVELQGLNEKETRDLLLSLSRHYKKAAVERILEHNPGRVEALRRITGGVVRTMVLLFEIFADDDDGSAFKDLEVVLDRSTPLYKHRMDDLSDQQQAIVEAIALNWDALSVKEIAERTRLDSKIISAQLQYLERNGIIEKRATKTKNHLYLVAERFFNIWFLMRLGRRSDEKRVLWLVRFFEEWCDGDMMKSRAAAHRAALQRGGFDPEAAFIYTMALANTGKLSPADHHELLHDTRSYLSKQSPDRAQDIIPSDLDMAYAALELWFSGQKEVAAAQLRALCGRLYEKKEAERIEKGIKAEGEVGFWEKEIAGFAKKIGNDFSYLGTPDYETAERCWLWAASLGYADAIERLGWLDLYRKRDIESAIERFLKAVDSGNTFAMFHLGLLFYNEKKDIESSIRWFQKFADNEFSTLGTYILGLLFEEKQDFESSITWYQRAANAGYGDAIFRLGVLYQKEKKDIESAILWLNKAAESGSVDAMGYLGWLYKIEKKDIELAFNWYLKAAIAGNYIAMFNVGWIFQNEKKDIGSAISWYEKAAEAGNVDAMFSLGWIFQNEKEDIGSAISWYEKAAEVGNVDAMSSLGWIFQKDKQDIDSAFVWYQKAAEAGNADAMFSLGWIFQDEKKDMDLANLWYQKSAEAGNAHAMNNIGAFFHNEKREYSTAIDWYKKSADKGNALAMSNLGRVYQYTQKDIPTAINWYKKAAEAGDTDAMSRLVELLMEEKRELGTAVHWAKTLLGNAQFLQEPLGKVRSFFTLLLGKGEAAWLYDLFTGPVGEEVQLKDRFKPVWYAILKQLDHPDFLRMGDELTQTVEEILAKARELGEA